MKKLTHILSGLLVLQLALVAGFWWNAQQSQGPASITPLLADADFDQLILQGNERIVSIVRSGEGWHVEGIDLPADAGAIDQLLGKLREISTSWPVATNRNSHERFEVTEGNFQRRLQLYRGDQVVADLLLGTSPGLRQIHVRRADEANVYRVPLGVHDMPTDTGHWMDGGILAADDITALETADFRLERTDDSWNLAQGDIQPGRFFDPDRAFDLAGYLSRLRVIESYTEADDVPEVFSLKVESPAGNWTYTFYRDDYFYLVKRSDREHRFHMSAYELQQIMDMNLEGLSKAEDAETDESEEVAS